MSEGRIPRVLVIGGSDSGGGAGVEADVKTLTARRAYALTAITALTRQDTEAVHEILPVPPAFIARAIRTARADPGVDAVKIGMLGDEAVIAAVADALAGFEGPVVIDPVMRASVGTPLLAPAALAAFRRELIPLAALITPNVPEAEALGGQVIRDAADLHEAAASLLTLGAPAVLLKGGHLPGEEVTDVLATLDGVETFTAPRIATRHTHGTGCTLAAAIAAELARGVELSHAVRRARAYLRRALMEAPGFGRGAGPLGHWAATPLDEEA
jgi:hydroxymethylpyrimidine/phosphomethylpyrimidine kinase